VSSILQSSIEPIVADGCICSKFAAKLPVVVERLTILGHYPCLLLVPTKQRSQEIDGCWIQRRASFEPAASRPPQDEEFS
jgi:hypothetical protein